MHRRCVVNRTSPTSERKSLFNFIIEEVLYSMSIYRCPGFSISLILLRRSVEGRSTCEFAEWCTPSTGTVTSTCTVGIKV